MIEFGTGRQTPVTNYAGATYSTGTQALYGIWDWNMGSLELSIDRTIRQPSQRQFHGADATDRAGRGPLGHQPVAGAEHRRHDGRDSGQYRHRLPDGLQCGSVLGGHQRLHEHASVWMVSATSYRATPIRPIRPCRRTATRRMRAIRSCTSKSYSAPCSMPVRSSSTPRFRRRPRPSCACRPHASGYTMAIAPDHRRGHRCSRTSADATNNFVSTNGMIVAGIGLSGVGSPSIVSANDQELPGDPDRRRHRLA